MDIHQAKDIVNNKFKYTSDPSVDTWSILDINQANIKGDCEDYSLTLIWLAEDKNILKFIISLLLMKYILWFVKTPKGVGHILTYIRKEKCYIDNISKELLPKEYYKTQGYKFIFPMLAPFVFIKLVFSLMFKKVID